MRTLATLLILVAIAASQPHHWFIHGTASLVVIAAFLAHCLGG